MRRVIARQEAGGAAPGRVPRGHNYDGVAALVAERVEKTSGRISAKRRRSAARAAGMAARTGTSSGWSRRRNWRGGGSITGGAAGGVVAG